MAKQPNFLLLITDQHRADHLGCYGNRIVRTPNVDRLAARGVAFDRFYVASPICMPNRATLMTGRMPSLHGVRHNGIPLSLEATTFPDILRGAGYRTAMVGKSHLQNMTGDPPRIPPQAYDPNGPADAVTMVAALRRGEGRYDQELSAKWRDDPTHELDLPYYGFDTVDLAIEHGDEVEGHYTRWLRAKRPDGDSLRGEALAEDQDWERDPRLAAPQARRTKLPEELYPTSYVAERTIARLEELAKTGTPFFLKCSFPDPHHPFTPPGRYWDMYDPADMVLPPGWTFDRSKAPAPVRWLLDQRDAGKAVKNTPMLFAATERETRAALALTFGMITMIDDAIGRILARLEALGLAENTVVAFMSDHGDYMGDHQLLLKGPIHYQSILRTPFLWCDPVQNARGRRTNLASTLDLARTFLERAGLPPIQGMQGRSLLPSIAGETTGPRDLLVEEEGQRIYLGFDRRVRVRTLMTERYRLSVYDGAAWGEIYDLQEDPHECNNLWDDPGCRSLRGELVERLARTMLAHSDTHPYPMGLA